MRTGVSDERKLITPDERLDYLPFAPAATSEPLGWPGLRAERFRMTLDNELSIPPMTHHLLILYVHPPDEMSLRSEGFVLNRPPPPCSVAVIPAGGGTTRGVWRGPSEAIHVHLEPQLISRVAAEAYDLDPARVELSTVYDLSHPQLRAAIRAIEAELETGAAGGRLLAESLGNVLAVHLIRHFVPTERAAMQPRGGLPKPKLQAALEYHRGTPRLRADAGRPRRRRPPQPLPLCPAVQDLHRAAPAPVRHRTPRRAAKQLMRGGDDLSLAQIAAQAGFSDQGHFTRHFKRLVGITPKRFR